MTDAAEENIIIEKNIHQKFKFIKHTFLFFPCSFFDIYINIPYNTKQYQSQQYTG